MSSDDLEFEVLLRRSSFGTRRALEKRATTPAEVVEEIMRRIERSRVVRNESAHRRSAEENNTSAPGRSPEHASEISMLAYITHVRLAGGEKHEHITHLKWRSAFGLDGQDTREALVAKLRRGEVTACVKDNRGEAEVRVVEATPPYLRTVADGRYTDNLLALPRF
jgi:hypothetical protein